ncbi:MAG: cell division protein FtsQ/DivIB [Gammaproteobacteria bacterium]
MTGDRLLRALNWLPAVALVALIVSVLLMLEQLTPDNTDASIEVELVTDSVLAQLKDIEVLQAQLAEENHLDLRKVQQQVMALPWVHSASVRRIWSAYLHIQIQPRTPLAIWDERHVLSQDGKIVPLAGELIYLDLPKVTATERDAAAAAVKLAVIQSHFDEMRLGIDELIVEEWGSLEVRSTNGLRVFFGTLELDQGLRNLRHIIATGISDQLSSIDLRYGDIVGLSRIDAGNHAVDREAN